MGYVHQAGLNTEFSVQQNQGLLDYEIHRNYQLDEVRNFFIPFKPRNSN